MPLAPGFVSAFDLIGLELGVPGSLSRLHHGCVKTTNRSGAAARVERGLAPAPGRIHRSS